MHAPPVRLLTAAAVAVAVVAVPTAEAKTVTVSENDPGVTNVKTTNVSLKKGDTLIIPLSENPSTGFRWSQTARPAALRYVSSRFIAPGTGSVPGAGGTRVYTYKAAKAGKGTLALLYSQRWHGGETATIFKLKVKVS